MHAPRPTPILSYTGDQPFGWREDPDGDAVLMLPHASNWSPLLEHAAGLMASTFFMICVVSLVVSVTRMIQPGQESGGIAAIVVGLLAIGTWAGIVVRCIRQAQAGTHTTVELRVTPDFLDITPIVSRIGSSCWDRTSIAGVTMDQSRPSYFRPSRVRLEIEFRDETRDTVWLPWPDDEPVEPHEQRLRSILGLSPS